MDPSLSKIMTDPRGIPPTLTQLWSPENSESNVNRRDSSDDQRSYKHHPLTFLSMHSLFLYIHRSNSEAWIGVIGWFEIWRDQGL